MKQFLTMKTTCIQLQDPQQSANYINDATTAVISTLPGLGTIGALLIVGAFYIVKFGRIVFSHSFAGDRSKGIEVALEQITMQLGLTKEQAIENLPALVASKRPMALADEIKVQGP